MENMSIPEEIASMSFEEALSALEDVVAQLEGGDLTLEKALALFERGQYLSAYCNQQLETASLRVEQLTADGEIVSLSLE
jgi:exodeoxyribonuclease VII small subunit